MNTSFNPSQHNPCQNIPYMEMRAIILEQNQKQRGSQLPRSRENITA